MGKLTKIEVKARSVFKKMFNLRKTFSAEVFSDRVIEHLEVSLSSVPKTPVKIAPTVFTLFISHSDFRKIKLSLEGLKQDVEKRVRDYINSRGYLLFQENLVVDIESTVSVGPGTVEVKSEKIRIPESLWVLVKMTGDEYRMLSVGDVITFGREVDNTWSLKDNNYVSSHHARIENREGRIILTDLDSTNGTFYQEKKIKEAVLQNNAVFALTHQHPEKFRVMKIERGEN